MLGRALSPPLEIHLEDNVLSSSRAPGVISIPSIAQKQKTSLARRFGALELPPAGRPFHFSYHMARLCRNITDVVPDFRHIDMDQVLVTVIRCRNDQSWGLQAKLVPLRFEGGTTILKRRGCDYIIQKVFLGEIRVRYVLSFYLPRFLNQSYDEKLVTVFHELYHISPTFDGDIRRFEGRASIHTHSQKEYDRRMAEYCREYLATRPPRRLRDFLKLPFVELEKRYGAVVGVQIPSPKLIPRRSKR